MEHDIEQNASEIGFLGPLSASFGRELPPGFQHSSGVSQAISPPISVSPSFKRSRGEGEASPILLPLSLLARYQIFTRFCSAFKDSTGLCLCTELSPITLLRAFVVVVYLLCGRLRFPSSPSELKSTSTTTCPPFLPFFFLTATLHPFPHGRPNTSGPVRRDRHCESPLQTTGAATGRREGGGQVCVELVRVDSLSLGGTRELHSARGCPLESYAGLTRPRRWLKSGVGGSELARGPSLFLASSCPF